MHGRTVFILIAATAGLFAGCGGKPEGPAGHEVRVAAAADLKYAFDEVKRAFEEANPGLKVQVTYGSSGNFFAQLTGRAPFDVFLSADSAYPRQLVEQGLAAEGSAFAYAVGRLVLWVPNRSKLHPEKDGVRALLDPSVKKVATANPRHAPYGRAAVATLKKLGVHDEVEGRLVPAENIAQAAQFVESGAADAGLIADSLALGPPMRGQGRFWLVPADAHPPLEQSGVILGWAKDRPAAEALRDFLLGPEGQAILGRYGFERPGG
jgi:molybdate transport system substrate-binding protein